MGTNRVIACLMCAALLLAGLPVFAGQGAPVQTARRGADDAEEDGGRRGDHRVATPAAALAGAETGNPKAKALFEEKCSACHALSRPLGKNKDRDGWAKTVIRMQKVNGCPITDAEAKEIIDYLVAVRGPAGN
jgi:cytochrome c5